MNTALLDTPSGLGGDMIVAALLDAGLETAALERVLASLGLGGYRLSVRKEERGGLAALRFIVEVLEPQPERRFEEIRLLIDHAETLSPLVKDRALSVFAVLAEAEAKVHRIPVGEVHFHEVGAVDSLIDVVAAAWGFDQFKIDELWVSALPLGRGVIKSQHGTLPVPAPATVELLRGFPVRLNDGSAEMVTPTAAAIVRALGRPLGHDTALELEIERVGYGCGARELADRPNVARLIVGSRHAAYEGDLIVEIETNIDDLSPQLYEHVVERLFAAGACDVTLTPTIMKKGRPGIIVSVLAEPSAVRAVAGTLFAETSTIGVRTRPVSRLKLTRHIREVETRYGPIRVKLATTKDGLPLTISPEYEDCRRAAATHRVALRAVMEEARLRARAAWGS